MVNNNITLEYNSSDKFNFIQKITQGGLFISSSIIITSKLNYGDTMYKLIGIIVVSPKEINFNYNVDNVKLIMIFIHKNTNNELLFIHLPICITMNSKPDIQLNNFFKSIYRKDKLLSTSNKVVIDELLLNNLNFGNTAPEIKLFDNNVNIQNYLKSQILGKIKNYSTITSVIVSTDRNSITKDTYDKIRVFTDSSKYPNIFVTTKPHVFSKLLNKFKPTKEGMANSDNSSIVDSVDSIKKSATTARSQAKAAKSSADAATKTKEEVEAIESEIKADFAIINPNGSKTEHDEVYIQCTPTGVSSDKLINLIQGDYPGQSGSSLPDGSSLFASIAKLFHYIRQCNIEYAIIGFIITVVVLYLLHYLFKKLFATGEAANTLTHIKGVDSVSRPLGS